MSTRWMPASRTIPIRLRIALLAGVLAGCSGAPLTAPASLQPSELASGTLTPPTPSGTRSPAPPTAAPTPVPLLGTLPTTPFDAARATALQGVLDAMITNGAPDAIAAVVTADGVWSGAAGIGGPDGRAATADDMFAIASVTKMFTSAVVMRLAEQGRIDLDAPLADYLGGLHDANGATVRQALGMRSGMTDFGPEAGVEIAADSAHAWTIAELVDRFPAASGQAGVAYRWASPNYILLGAAIEHVTGRPYASALRAEVLDPVGATRILEQGAGVSTPLPWALPTADHVGRFTLADLGAGGAISCIASATYGPGSGSIASDAPSLAAWAWHLFAGDIVNQASLEAMIPGPDGHGLGLESIRGIGRQAAGQTGGKTGYGTILAVDRTEQAVVVLLVNDEEFVVERYVSALLAAAGVD